MVLASIFFTFIQTLPVVQNDSREFCTLALENLAPGIYKNLRIPKSEIYIPHSIEDWANELREIKLDWEFKIKNSPIVMRDGSWRKRDALLNIAKKIETIEKRLMSEKRVSYQAFQIVFIFQLHQYLQKDPAFKLDEFPYFFVPDNEGYPKFGLKILMPGEEHLRLLIEYDLEKNRPWWRATVRSVATINRHGSSVHINHNNYTLIFKSSKKVK